MRTVLHFTESYGAGVGTAIEQYMQFAGVTHSLLARSRPETVNALSIGTESRMLVSSRHDLVRRWHGHRNYPFDIVHVHSTVAGVIARIFPHPTAALVYSPHALAVNRENAAVRHLVCRAERNLARRTQAFAAVSEAERWQLTQLAQVSQPTFLIPHAIDANLHPQPRTSRAPRIVSVGRLNHQKNPESIFDLPLRLSRSNTKFEFVWIGEGDPARRSLLVSAGWTVTGWLPQAAVRTILSTSHLTIHPARYEGLPLSVLESLAAGTPVIAADLPVFHHLHAVFRYTSPVELVSAVMELTKHPQEWERRATAGREQVVEQFNRNTQDAALSELYRVVIDS